MLNSCKQHRNDEYDPRAMELNDRAKQLIPFSDNPDSARLAISLLDRAIAIDSNFINAYGNKLIFIGLKDDAQQIKLYNKLIQLKPEDAYRYNRAGLLYAVTGDSVAASRYFKTALDLYIKSSQQMKRDNGYYFDKKEQALSLLMLGDTAKGNDIIRYLIEHKRKGDPALSNVDTAYIKNWINKSWKEMAKFETTPVPDENESKDWPD